MFRKRISSGLTILAILGLTIGVIGCAPLMPTTSQPKVLIMLSDFSDYSVDYFLTNEVGVMVDMLSKAGFKVVTASDTGQLLGSKTTLQPDMKIADVKVEEYVGFIIPCMSRPITQVYAPEDIAVIKKAVAQGKLVAAQMGGIYVLDKAGVLQGKQIAILEENNVDFPDAIYKGEGVVQDGNIITGGICPYMAMVTGKKDTTIDLTQKFIDTLKLH
jgi:putative intracellular protease/amidase